MVMSTYSIAPVAIVLPSNATAMFPPASRSAMIPEPTTQASKKNVPMASLASARCIEYGLTQSFGGGVYWTQRENVPWSARDSVNVCSSSGLGLALRAWEDLVIWFDTPAMIVFSDYRYDSHAERPRPEKKTE